MKKFMIMFLMLIVSIVSFAGYESDMIARMKIAEEAHQKQVDTGINILSSTYDLEGEWDDELNKIYKLLISKLSNQKKNELRKEERAWIKKRDREGEKSAANGGGGQISAVFESSTKTKLTKERAIELARRYDKLNIK